MRQRYHGSLPCEYGRLGAVGQQRLQIGLSYGVGVERLGVDVGEVEPILDALGESDCDQTQATAGCPPNARVQTTLDRHPDFQIKDRSLQPGGYLRDSFALEIDSAPATLAMDGDDESDGAGWSGA